MGFSKIINIRNYSETIAREYFDSQSELDPIEGLWQSSNGFKYAIERDVENEKRINERFRIVVLDPGSEGWKKGDIRGLITYGISEEIYSMKIIYRGWLTGKESGSEMLFLYLKNPGLATYEYVSNELRGTISKVDLYKLYPKVLSSPSGEDSKPEGSTPPPSNGNKWSGTGFFISTNGYIITNQHVIDGASSIRVTNIDGDHNSFYNARLEVSDKQNDLAIIKITDDFNKISELPYSFKFISSNIGEECWVLGYPLTTTMGKDIKLTNGIISSKSGFDGNIVQYQISAPVQPGNSGGPVFDKDGYVIGVVQAKHRDAENASYAIKFNYVSNLIDMLPSSISFPQTNPLANKTLPQQVAEASKAVVLIICE